MRSARFERKTKTAPQNLHSQRGAVDPLAEDHRARRHADLSRRPLPALLDRASRCRRPHCPHCPKRPRRQDLIGVGPDADHDIADNDLHAGGDLRLRRHRRCDALDDQLRRHRPGRHAPGHDRLPRSQLLPPAVDLQRVVPCRRATSDTEAPDTRRSAAIRAAPPSCAADARSAPPAVKPPHPRSRPDAPTLPYRSRPTPPTPVPAELTGQIRNRRRGSASRPG